MAQSSTQNNDLLDYCAERLSNMRGVTVNFYDYEIYLIPLSVIEDTGRGVLIISAKDGGVFRYDGVRELNEFMLVKSGFFLPVAKKLARLINALREHIDLSKRRIIQEVTLQIENQKGNYDE